MLNYILHCVSCDHEWPSFDREEKCDWCGGEAEVIHSTKDVSKYQGSSPTREVDISLLGTVWKTKINI